MGVSSAVRNTTLLTWGLLALWPIAGVQAQGQDDAQGEPFVILPPVEQPATVVEGSAASAPPVRDELDLEPPPPSEPPSEWYGWQTLALDGASLTVAIAGSAATDSAGPAVVGLVGYLAGPPIAHGLHRNDWGWASLGMRAGSLVLMTGGIFVALSGCFEFDDDARPPSCDGRQVTGSVLFFTGAGLSVTSIVLDAVFAHAPTVKPDTPTLGLWGDPLTGSAGLSVSMVR